MIIYLLEIVSYNVRPPDTIALSWCVYKSHFTMVYGIYTWKTVYGHFFCPLWVLPVTDVFFCSIAYFDV